MIVVNAVYASLGVITAIAVTGEPSTLREGAIVWCLVWCMLHAWDAFVAKRSA